MSQGLLLTLCALIALAFVIETVAGFGSMVVALTLGALWFDVNALLAWVVPVNMVLSAWLLMRGRGALDSGFLFRRLLPLMTLGLLLGSALAQVVTGVGLKIGFGALVVVLSLWQLWQLSRATQATQPLPMVLRVTGLLSAGVIHGIFGTGGPLAVFVTSRELPDKSAFRATLSALWLVLNGLLIGRLMLDHVFTAESLKVSATLLLPLAVGLGVGEWLHHRLDERQFRFGVSSLLVVAGLVLVVASVRALP